MCGIERRSEKRRRTQEQYIEDVHSVNPYIDVVGEYIDNMTPISHKCKIDGNIWTARPNDILNGKGCPQCNESHGERCVRLWLDNLGVSYVREKTFDDCRNIKPLPFDFYLPDYNICIEYQGRQHYEPVDYFGGEEQFKAQQHNDNIKKEYCDSNNIKLLCIPYYEDVDEQLNNFLFI